jgi:hypothetical protein
VRRVPRPTAKLRWVQRRCDGGFLDEVHVLFAISIIAIAAGSAVCPAQLARADCHRFLYRSAGLHLSRSASSHPVLCVSGSILRVRLYAIHRGGRLREFYSQPAGGPSMAASGLQDSGAASDIESYLLRVTGEDGAEIRRVLFLPLPTLRLRSDPASISHAGHERQRYIGALLIARDDRQCRFIELLVQVRRGDWRRVREGGPRSLRNRHRRRNSSV